MADLLDRPISNHSVRVRQVKHCRRYSLTILGAPLGEGAAKTARPGVRTFQIVEDRKTVPHLGNRHRGEWIKLFYQPHGDAHREHVSRPDRRRISIGSIDNLKYADPS
jgi:hypothetical protein